MKLKNSVNMNIAEQFQSLDLSCAAEIQRHNNQLNNLNEITKKKSANNNNTSDNDAKDDDDDDTKAWKFYYQPDEGNNICLHYACWNGYPKDIFAALLRLSPDPRYYNLRNANLDAPIHLAVQQFQSMLVRELLLAGADPLVRDSHGNTALHLAVMKRDRHSVRALTDPFVAAEIHEAYYQYGNKLQAQMHPTLNLVKVPVSYEIANYEGERCVHIAALLGDIDILRILVMHGADINARIDKSGQTVLHIAVAKSNELLVNFLLTECPNLNVELMTYSGLTAFQMASVNGNERMQYLLFERGGAMPLTPPYSGCSDDSGDDMDMDMDTASDSDSNTMIAGC